MTKTETTSRFINLFKGNPNAYLGYLVEKQQYFEKGEAPKKSHFDSHLYGNTFSVGIIPIRDSQFSGFGVIDFDNHSTENGIDIIKLEKKVRELNLPLVVCRSKSGSAHAYLLGRDRLTTHLLLKVLHKFRDQLKGVGETHVDIFPRQSKLENGSLGNGINLPYANSEDTKRYCISNGRPLNLHEFLIHAESKLIDNSDLTKYDISIHEEAPYCIEILLKQRVGEGSRNDLLCHYSVYAKKAFPDNWEEVVYKFNTDNFTDPLTYEEVTSVVKSMGKTDYKYKCSLEMCKKHCNSSVCVTRKFGITPTEQNDLLVSEIPQFGQLIKYETNPPRYEIEISERRISLSTDDLLDHKLFRKRVFETLDLVLKPKKNENWLDTVNAMVKNMIIEEAPDDASMEGIFRSLLLEYIKRANLSDAGDNKEHRKLVMVGTPVVQLIRGQRYVLFKGVHFIESLKRRNIGTVDLAKVWMSAKDLGAKPMTVRCDDVSIRVWALPLDGRTGAIEEPKGREDVRRDKTADIVLPKLPPPSSAVDFKPEF